MSNHLELEPDTDISSASSNQLSHSSKLSHHVFFFVFRRWQAGLFRIAQGLFLLIAGLFLLSQVTSTPNLMAQMIILGCVLAIGGCYFLWSSLADLIGFFRIDRQGIHLRNGWSIRSVPWHHVVAWQVNSGTPRDLQRAVRVFLPEPNQHLIVDGDYFHNDDLLRIHGAMLRFAAANGHLNTLTDDQIRE